MNAQNKQRSTRESLIDTLFIQQNEVIATIGAGDIDRMVYPIKKELEERSGYAA